MGRENCNGYGNDRVRTNGGYSNYNGLQTEFRTNNLFNQLTMKATYTYSKTLDNVSEIFSTFAGGGANSFAQNPLNTGQGEYGISGLDFPNTFTLSAYEMLPFMRAQHGVMGTFSAGGEWERPISGSRAKRTRRRSISSVRSRAVAATTLHSTTPSLASTTMCGLSTATPARLIPPLERTRVMCVTLLELAAH